jgi:hypothetical protein
MMLSFLSKSSQFCFCLHLVPLRLEEVIRPTVSQEVFLKDSKDVQSKARPFEVFSRCRSFALLASSYCINFLSRIFQSATRLTDAFNLSPSRKVFVSIRASEYWGG